MFVITGGGSGIGKSLAFSLAKRNQPVLIVGRREHLLQETAAFFFKNSLCVRRYYDSRRSKRNQKTG